MADRLEPAKPNNTYTQAQLLELADKLDLIEDEVTSAKAEVSSCVRRRTALRKQIEGIGVPLDVLDHVRKLNALTGAERERFSYHTARVATFFGKPIGHQASFDDEITEADRAAFSVHNLKSIDNEGYSNGLAGNPEDGNPYTPGTEEHARYRNAWMRGQEAKVKAEIGKDEAPAPKRGRPRKAA